MKNVLIPFIAILALLLAAVSANSIKPSLRISIPEMSSKHSNVSFTKISAKGGSKILIADIAPTKNKKNIAILICYPDSGNIQKWLGYGLMLAEMGYQAIMFDYRGFGGSDKFTIDKDTLYYDEFINDAQAAYGYMATTYPSYKKGLFGLSMGSIMASKLALELKGDFLIADSFVANIDEAESRIEQITKRNIILPPSGYSYNDDIQYLNIPMLLFSGKYDTVCTASSLSRLSNQQTQIVVYNGGHLEGPQSLNMAYFSRIDKFISKTLSTQKTTNTAIPLQVGILAIILVLIAIKTGQSLVKKHSTTF